MRTTLLILSTAVAILLGGTAAALDTPATQDPGEPSPSTGVPTTIAPAVEVPIITTTLPEAQGDLGRIIPRPNSGVEPESPGDRGGWQQLALFLAVCAVILGMAAFVWQRSRIARATRESTGADPVTQARQHGADVRAPRPPGIR